MTQPIKLIIAALCGQLWVFLCCAFIAATFDFTQWSEVHRFGCVAFGTIGALAAIIITVEMKL